MKTLKYRGAVLEYDYFNARNIMPDTSEVKLYRDGKHIATLLLTYKEVEEL